MSRPRKKAFKQFLLLLLMPPSVILKHTSWFLLAGAGFQAAQMSRAVLCQGRLYPSSTSGTKPPPIHSARANTASPVPDAPALVRPVTVTADGSSGLRIPAALLALSEGFLCRPDISRTASLRALLHWGSPRTRMGCQNVIAQTVFRL